MNFVRACDERDENYIENLFNITKGELELVNELQIENTFLLQYDALCDERYVKLFKENASEKTELGLWLEIVEPLTSACGLPYKSERGWKWDWHIIPGLPMGYTPQERELLLKEAMRKFNETFGVYPKTVGGWLIDTHSVNFLAENYEIDAFCICRDQVNTDAYTLIGGYFNGAYYPSKNNMFTPAQSAEEQVNTPVFRLLGPCPVNNYDGSKFLPDDLKGYGNVYTLEPAWGMGLEPKCIDWFYKTYFDNETLGFSAIQLGQENSFTSPKIVPTLRMQLEKALAYVKSGKAEFKKYCDTGRLFKSAYSETPATTVCALDNWNSADTQSVYYDCKNYVANIFRNGKTVFIRALYKFDEKIKDYYLDTPCTRFDAVYENLPVTDTVIWQKGNSEGIGIVLDRNAQAFEAAKIGEAALCVKWADKSVSFYPEKIEISGCAEMSFNTANATADITLLGNALKYHYNGYEYSVKFYGCEIEQNGDKFLFKGDSIVLNIKD